jgi:hypothetical protein
MLRCHLAVGFRHHKNNTSNEPRHKTSSRLTKQNNKRIAKPRCIEVPALISAALLFMGLGYIAEKFRSITARKTAKRHRLRASSQSKKCIMIDLLQFTCSADNFACWLYGLFDLVFSKTSITKVYNRSAVL